MVPPEEQLRRVVARLAVNVHGRREVGCPRVVEPIVVGEPRVGRGHRHELAGTRVVETDSLLPALVEHLGHAAEPLEQRSDVRLVGRVSHVDVSHLMISHREGARSAGIEQLPAQRLLHGQEPSAPQRPVDVHRPADLADAILGDDQHLGAAPSCMPHDRSD